MTKTLTEQWREGTLSLNYYYIKLKSGKYGIDHTVMSIDGDLPKTKFAYSNFAIEEVLAQVPSYDKYKQLVSKTEQLEKKLEIALEVLGIIAMHSKDPVDAVQAACAISQIKEMEGVK